MDVVRLRRAIADGNLKIEADGVVREAVVKDLVEAAGQALLGFAGDADVVAGKRWDGVPRGQNGDRRAVGANDRLALTMVVRGSGDRGVAGKATCWSRRR